MALAAMNCGKFGNLSLILAGPIMYHECLMMIFLQFVGRTPANPLRTLSYFAPQSEAAEVKWIEIVKKKNDLRLITEEGYLN